MYSKILLIVRILSIPTAILTVFIFSDLVSPVSKFDLAKVTKKSRVSDKHGYDYYIDASGEKEYSEQVSRVFFDKVKKGDTIRIGLTKYFEEWKYLQLIREEKVVCTTRGSDIYAMAIFGLAFIVPLFSFLPRSIKKAKTLVVISLILIEPIALCIWIFSDVFQIIIKESF